MEFDEDDDMEFDEDDYKHCTQNKGDCIMD